MPGEGVISSISATRSRPCKPDLRLFPAVWVNRRNEQAEARCRPFTEGVPVAEAVGLL